MKILDKYSIKPNNPHIYEIAFIHESYANEHDLSECYERLEFLGDSVLDLVVSKYLYKKNPKMSEGELTNTRSNYVCKQALFYYSTEIGIDKNVRLGVGETLSHREKDSIVSDIFESFLGAIYIDQGINKVTEVIYDIVIPHIESKEIFFKDYKSELKTLCDSLECEVNYKILKEEGKPHEKIFTIGAIIKDNCYGVGVGGSKKEAQQNAAMYALQSVDEYK